MRVLWHVQQYLPKAKSGSEWNAHEINKWLMERGHLVKVMTSAMNNEYYEYEGIPVFNRSHDWYFHHDWADVIFTQLDFAADVAEDCKKTKKPAVWFAHNTFNYISVRRNQHINVVYNSHWGSEHGKYPNNSFILQPPVNIDHYRVERGEEITLINLNRNKGAELFYEVAQMMPEYKFLAVQGGYGEQIYKDLPNVTYMVNQPDIRNAYKRTKILLMPSQYESWGRTATEAMASGIPCIVSDLPALRENCGDAGIYCSPDRPHQWVNAIKNVVNNYELCSRAAFDRADELRPHDKLINFEQWVTTLIR